MARFPKSLEDLAQGRPASDALIHAAQGALAPALEQARLGYSPGGAIATALREQQRIQRQIADFSGVAGAIANTSGALGTVERALEEQRKSQKLIYGGSMGGTVERVMEEQRKFERLVNGGFDIDRHRSQSRDMLDALASPATQRGSTGTGRATGSPQAAAVSTDATNIDSVADIGQRVRAARRTMGMTQLRFADLAGVGRRFIVELEKGKPTLEIGLVLKVCNAAGVKLKFDR